MCNVLEKHPDSSLSQEALDPKGINSQFTDPRRSLGARGTLLGEPESPKGISSQFTDPRRNLSARGNVPYCSKLNQCLRLVC